MQKKLGFIYVTLFSLTWITTNEYDNYVREWKKEEGDLIEQIRDHSTADGEFLITANYILDLANRAYELFMSSNAEQKRQIINFLFMNLEGHGEKLIYKLKAPLGAVLIAGKSQNWLSLADTLGTEYRAQIMKFGKELKNLKTPMSQSIA